MQKIKGKGKGSLWLVRSAHLHPMVIVGMFVQVRDGLDSVWAPETAKRAVTVRDTQLFSL